MLSLKPDSNAKCLEILKKVNVIDFADISEYVIAMQSIHEKVNRHWHGYENYETRPLAI